MEAKSRNETFMLTKSQIDDIIKNKPKDFLVISGDDGIAFPLITQGASGVISVIGNAFPKEFSRMVRLALMGDYDNARAIHHQFTELFDLLFVCLGLWWHACLKWQIVEGLQSALTS